MTNPSMARMFQRAGTDAKLSLAIFAVACIIVFSSNLELRAQGTVRKGFAPKPPTQEKQGTDSSDGKTNKPKEDSARPPANAQINAPNPNDPNEQSDANKASASKSSFAEMRAKIRQVHANYDLHMKRYGELQAVHQRIGQVFRDTERELATLQNETLRHQMAIAALAYASMQMGGDIGPQGLPGDRVSQNDVRRNSQIAGKNQVDVEALMRSEQVRQLSAAQQAVFRRRMEAARDLEQLQRDVEEWQIKWPQFMGEYWKFTDPEHTRTRSENRAVIEELQSRAANNVPARIAEGLVYVRLDQLQESVQALDAAIEIETQLKPIAYAARSLAHSVGQRKGDAKKDMAKALSLNAKDPFVRWLRAQISASQGNFANAKKELGVLATESNHEVAAQRLLAVMGAIRSTNNAREANMALQQAKLALDLTGDQDWYSNLVIAMAHHANGNAAEAKSHLKKAKAFFGDGEAELCDRVRAWIELDQPIDWNFLQ